MNYNIFEHNIPKGYQYCMDCELLTPHTLDNGINPSKSIPTDWTCDICHSKKDGYNNCPKCGWEHDPDNFNAPEKIKIKQHTDKCYEKHGNLNYYKCNCPEVDCYTMVNIFNYKEWKPTHLDCWDALEWSYDVMCPICNCVFEVEDGNC